MVARTGTPVPCPARHRNSTGYACGAQASPVSPARFMIPSLAVPGVASPDKSPLMSGIRTGTPAAESCSAIPCNVLVLPVPVAPATSPCLLNIASGIRTSAAGSTDPSITTEPSVTLCAAESYPCAIRSAAALADDPVWPADAADPGALGCDMMVPPLRRSARCSHVTFGPVVGRS